MAHTSPSVASTKAKHSNAVQSDDDQLPPLEDTLDYSVADLKRLIEETEKKVEEAEAKGGDATQERHTLACLRADLCDELAQGQGTTRSATTGSAADAMEHYDDQCFWCRSAAVRIARAAPVAFSRRAGSCTNGWAGPSEKGRIDGSSQVWRRWEVSAWADATI